MTQSDDILRAMGEVARTQAELPVAPLSAASRTLLQERIIASLNDIDDAETRQRSLRIRRVWMACGSGAAAVMAAASALLFLWPATQSPLPSYQATFHGGQRQQRSEAGATAGLVLVDRGGRIAWTMRPATPVRDALQARVFALHDREIRPLAAQPQISEDGAVRFVAHSDELLQALAPGDWELVFVVGRPGVFSLPPATLLARGMQGEPTLRIHKQRVRLSDGRP